MSMTNQQQWQKEIQLTLHKQVDSKEINDF